MRPGLPSLQLEQLMIERALRHLDYVLDDAASIDTELARQAMAAATVLAVSVWQQRRDAADGQALGT